MGKSNCTFFVRNEEVVRGVKAEMNILPSITRRNVNWIGYILRMYCFITHLIEGNIGGMRSEGRRYKQLLNDLREREDTGS
jgi:hypothetical protein